MRTVRGRSLVWGAPVVSVLLLAATGATVVAMPVSTDRLLADRLANVVLALVLPLLGAAVLAAVPRSPLGRLWVTTGLAGALTLAVHTYAQAATEVRPGALPAGTAAAWVSSWLWVLGFTPLLTYGLLVFPDGRLPSRRWTPLLVVSGAAVLLPVLGQALAPGPLEELPVDNPFGVEALAGATAVARSVGFLCFTAGAAGGAAALALRWRRGTPAERDQLALPAVAAVLVGLAFLVHAVDPLVPLMDAALALVVTVLLCTFGVAVLRDEVAGADVVLRRSLTYGLLTSAVAITYLGVVATLSGLMPDPGAGLLATLAAALLILPLRDRLQRAVDRGVYGDRHDPLAALDRLGDRLEAAAEPEAVLEAVAQAVAVSLRLRYVQVVVRHGTKEVVAASAGTPAGPLVRLPLSNHGEEVGALLLSPRAGQQALSTQDLAVLSALRRQAAPAVAAVRLAGELQASRQRLITAREEERRRLRRDLHDGLGPTLAGIGLGLEVASASADADVVRRLLAELKAEASTAVLDVRRLVEDLRPPALDELGLVGALRRHADRISARDGTEVVVHAPRPLTGLPAAIEVAAYRIALEAMTNALRHGVPSHCALTLDLDDALHLEVTDNGSGLPASPRPGVGLSAMRERAAELGGTCTITPAAGGGTTVRALLPVPSP